MHWMFVIGSNTDCQTSVQPEQLRGSWDFAYTAWYLDYLDYTCGILQVGLPWTTEILSDADFVCVTGITMISDCFGSKSISWISSLGFHRCFFDDLVEFSRSSPPMSPK